MLKGLYSKRESIHVLHHFLARYSLSPVKAMAYPELLRTQPIKRSVKRVSFGTISSAEYIPYGCFQKVVHIL